MLILCLLLLALVAYLAFRLRAIRRTVERMLESAEQGKTHIPVSQGWGGAVYLERLSGSLNHLIRDRDKASQQEKNYLKQLDVTLGSLSEAVLVVDDTGGLHLANAAARTLLGITGSPQGQKLESFVTSAGLLDFMRQIRTGSHDVRGQVEMQSKGQTLYLEVTGAHITMEGENNPHYILFVLHDITALKRLEGIRKEFVANVSHELRTPVTIIKGYSDTLIEDYPQLSDEERLRFFHKIHKSVGRLNLLLEDLLVLSRLESTGVRINRSRCSLTKLITETLESVQPKIRECGASVELSIAPDADAAWLDPVKMSQVVQNLVDNVIRYAKQFRLLTITCEKMGDGLRMHFRDDGCGIPEADVSHIFERFYRVDKGRSRELGGTGLGLSIVKHIVQLHGGEVRAESAPGKGLLIAIDIPACLPAKGDQG